MGFWIKLHICLLRWFKQGAFNPWQEQYVPTPRTVLDCCLDVTICTMWKGDWDTGMSTTAVKCTVVNCATDSVSCYLSWHPLLNKMTKLCLVLIFVAGHSHGQCQSGCCAPINPGIFGASDKEANRDPPHLLLLHDIYRHAFMGEVCFSLFFLGPWMPFGQTAYNELQLCFIVKQRSVF